MTFAIGITLATLLAASLWIRQPGPPDEPKPVVRTDPSGGLAELREAASSWLSGQRAELDRALPRAPSFASETIPRPVGPELHPEAAVPVPIPPPDLASESAPQAPAQTAVDEVASQAPPSVRDLDRSGETVRRLLALYARLETRP